MIGVERALQSGAPPNNVNAADDELRFAPFLAADPRGRYPNPSVRSNEEELCASSKNPSFSAFLLDIAALR